MSWTNVGRRGYLIHNLIYMLYKKVNEIEREGEGDTVKILRMLIKSSFAIYFHFSSSMAQCGSD